MEILIYLALHTLNMAILKKMSLLGVGTDATLIFRGLGCIFMALLLAYKNNFSLVPNKPKLQGMRLIIAGLGLGLMIASYDYINASTVAVLFKFDVIFLIFFGLLLGKNLKSMIFYGIGAFALLATHIFFFKETSEQLIGYFLALGGTFILALGFILLNKSGKTENQAVTCLVPGVSILLFGLVLSTRTEGYFYLYPLEHILILFVSGIVMFSIYIYTLKLYKKRSVEFAELLTFVCIIAFIPIEIFALKLNLSIQHIVSILVIAAYTLFIYYKKEA